MQNCPDSGTACVSTPQSDMGILSPKKLQEKSSNAQKYWINM